MALFLTILSMIAKVVLACPTPEVSAVSFPATRQLKNNLIVDNTQGIDMDLTSVFWTWHRVPHNSK